MNHDNYVQSAFCSFEELLAQIRYHGHLGSISSVSHLLLIISTSVPVYLNPMSFPLFQTVQRVPCVSFACFWIIVIWIISVWILVWLVCSSARTHLLVLDSYPGNDLILDSLNSLNSSVVIPHCAPA